jgi:predicted AAA+ superfamily ATPase
MYERSVIGALERRLTESRRFIQIVIGPRQVGKTTLVQQTLRKLPTAYLYGSADTPQLRDRI